MWIARREMARLLKSGRAAEKRIIELERLLTLERDRNRRREDELLDRCLTKSGSYAITPEKSKDARPQAEPPITALDEARLAAYKQAAVAAGRTEQEALAQWKARRAGQPVLPVGNDEPYVLPTA